MSFTFNMVGGGGVANLFAAIGVTYPAGSALTCTDGTKTLTAKTTTGQWVFSIPYAGTWTVTATYGTDTASQEVEITTEGQSVSVELFYRLYFVKDGAVSNNFIFDKASSVYTEQTGYAQFKTKSGTSGNGWAFWSDNSSGAMNLSRYSRVCFDAGATSTRNDAHMDAVYFGAVEEKVSGTADMDVSIELELERDQPLARDVYSVDISIVSSGYLALYIADNTGTTTLKVYNAWLE